MFPEPDRNRRAHARAGLLAVALAALAAQAGAADYDEAVAGEISADRLLPTRILLTDSPRGANGLRGNNIVSGTLGRNGGVVDRDYFTAVVPQGFALTELRVGNQTTTGGGVLGSFIGVATGDVMPVAESATTAAGLLGRKHYGLADRGTDILDDLSAAGDGATGFARPLGAGAYTFWVQELSPGTYNYRFNLIVSAVPEPSQWALLAAGLAMLGWRRRAGAIASVPRTFG